jgi:hypothetical protein
MMKNLLCCIILSAMLCACGHKPVVSPTLPTVPNQHRVNIDKSLLVPCKPIPDLSGTSELDLVYWISEWKLIYLECKANHLALVNSIKTAFPAQDSK